MATVHWQRGVPYEISSLDTLVRPDYTDLFTAPVSEPVDTSPQRWGTALAVGAPRRLRLLLRLAMWAQRRIRGLRIDPRPSAGRLFGWKLAAQGDNWFRLEADSWFGTGHLLFHTDGSRVSFATLLRYDHPMGRVLWAAIWRIHRRVGIALLGYAATAPDLRRRRAAVTA